MFRINCRRHAASTPRLREDSSELKRVRNKFMTLDVDPILELSCEPPVEIFLIKLFYDLLAQSWFYVRVQGSRCYIICCTKTGTDFMFCVAVLM